MNKTVENGPGLFWKKAGAGNENVAYRGMMTVVPSVNTTLAV